MNRRIYCMLTGLLLVVAASCDEGFGDLNLNPNSPDRSAVKPEMLLPGVIRAVANYQVNQSFNRAGLVVQHLSKLRGFEDDQYQWASTAPGWTHYATLKDVYNMYDIAMESGEQKNYMAVALIMKALIFSILTDSFGDIPYSQAIKGKVPVNFPSYDTQEEIYNGMLADLLTANNLIESTDNIIRNDIMFNGDMMKWKKFSNSLRLRMLMRISDRRDVSSAMTEIVNDPATYPVFSHINDNAVLKYLADSPNQFPLHTLRITDQAYHVISSSLMDRLNQLNDPRRTVFAKPTLTSQRAFDEGTGQLEYKGVGNGLTPQMIAAIDPANVSNLGRNYFDEPNAADGKLMTYAELMFILAEAAQKGWIPGSAEDYYLTAVDASFDYYKVTPPPGYFEQPGAEWQEDNALELIGTQKWIDLYWNGYEAWFDWRRTNIPQLTSALVNLNESQIPVRFEYPAEEQDMNKRNYQAAVGRQGVDNINTRVWWDVNPN